MPCVWLKKGEGNLLKIDMSASISAAEWKTSWAVKQPGTFFVLIKGNAGEPGKLHLLFSRLLSLFCGIDAHPALGVGQCAVQIIFAI